MLKLSKVEYGIQPFGRGAGSPGFAFHFSEDSSAPIKSEDYQKQSASDMYKTITKYVRDNSLDAEWENAQCGAIPMFFVGTCYSKDDYAAINEELVHLIEKDSLSVQKILYNLSREEDGTYDNGEPRYRMKGNWDKLRPPSRIYVGEGKYTYANDFYQTMECVYINCNFDRDETGKCVWNNDIFAVTQMAQANSCYMYFRIKDEDELKAFLDMANDEQHPVGMRWKLFVFAIIDNPELDISEMVKGKQWHRYAFDMSKILPNTHYLDFEI